MYQKNRFPINTKGFTLMETLIVIFIISIVIIPIFHIIGWNFQTTDEGLQRQKQQEDFRIFNTFIIQDLMFSRNIQVTNKPGKDTLSYTKNNGDSETFYFENNALYRKDKNKKVKIATGGPNEPGVPTVYLERTNMIRFNFFATDIDSLFSLTVKLRLIP